MAGHGGFLKFKTCPGRCDMVIINSPLKGLISARQDVDGSPEGSICVVVCRTEIGCLLKCTKVCLKL